MTHTAEARKLTAALPGGVLRVFQTPECPLSGPLRRILLREWIAGDDWKHYTEGAAISARGLHGTAADGALAAAGREMRDVRGDAP